MVFSSLRTPDVSFRLGGLLPFVHSSIAALYPPSLPFASSSEEDEFRNMASCSCVRISFWDASLFHPVVLQLHVSSMSPSQQVA